MPDLSCLACQREDHQQCSDPRRFPVDDTYLSPGELMTICCCAEAREILERGRGAPIEELQAQDAEAEALEAEELDELEEEEKRIIPPARPAYDQAEQDELDQAEEEDEEEGIIPEP